MSGPRRGVILYGHGVGAVADALADLDPRYVRDERAVLEPGQVPVLCRRDAAQARAARDASPEVDWLVVDMYRPEEVAGRAGAPQLSLNSSKIDPETAAHAIDQPDLVTWYEVIDPIQVATIDGGPPEDDYGNLVFTVPDGNRMVAHAVKEGETAPGCLQGALQVLPSSDLWALVRLRNSEVCQACTLRHP